MTSTPITTQPTPASPVGDATEAAPYLTLKGGRTIYAIDFKELWRFRGLLLALGTRDLRLRYKQTILGVAWVLIQPLMAAGIFTLVFGIVAKLPSEGLPYFLFSYTGQLGWLLFSQLLGRVSACLLGNAHLISKVYFPRLILPLASFPGVLVDFGVALCLMAVLMLIYGVVPGAAILLVPVWLLLLAMIALGVGLLAASLAVSYRDVTYILPVVTQVLLYASPIAYSLAAAPESVRPLYIFNPLTGALEGLRWSLLNTSAPPLSAVAVTVVAAIVAMGAGVLCFKTMERKFADVI